VFEKAKKELEAFKDAVVKEAKATLVSQGKGGGELENSIRGTVKEMKGGFIADFLMEDYGDFVDQGVSGKKKKYNTPFSYKDKMPPPSKLDKWIVRKGLKGIRDENGKFIKRKSLQFLIARGIFNNGIKPSLFFTKPFEKHRIQLTNKLSKAFKESVELQIITDAEKNGLDVEN